MMENTYLIVGGFALIALLWFLFGRSGPVADNNARTVRKAKDFLKNK